MPVPKTIRQQIVETVETQFKRIKIVNTYTLNGETRNYRTDLGNNIYRWRSSPFEVADLPAGIFRDLDEPVKEAGLRSARQMRQLHCQLEMATVGSASDDDMRLLLADA